MREIQTNHKIDINHMTLHDFRCRRCGKVNRRYLPVRELALTGICDCGGFLDSGLDQQIIAHIKDVCLKTGGLLPRTRPGN